MENGIKREKFELGRAEAILRTGTLNTSGMEHADGALNHLRSVRYAGMRLRLDSTAMKMKIRDGPEVDELSKRNGDVLSNEPM